MSPPHRCWQWAAALATTAGVLVACASWGAGPVLGALGVGSALVAALILLLQPADRTRTWTPTDLARSSLRSACVTIAVVAGLVVSAPLAFTALLVLGCSSPWSRRALSTAVRRNGGSPTEAPSVEHVEGRGDVVDPLPDETVTALSDLALCQEWRRSYVRLSRAWGRGALDAVAVSRRRLLDEIERRHPLATEVWLRSARAAGGPERFLGAGSPAHPPCSDPPA